MESDTRQHKITFRMNDEEHVQEKIMTRKKETPKGRVIINPEIQFTDDDICLLLFGKNINDLAQDIRNNKDGEYDHLYVKERK